MAVELDLKDRKILALLDENSRYTNSEIAKKVGLSKPAVEYRLQRFVKNNIIFAYYTIIDFTRLGYSQYKLYFKFQDASLNEEKEIQDYWIKSKNTVWVGEIRGRWDLAVSILATSNYEFGKVLNQFLNKYSRFILEKDVLLTEYSPIFAREYLEMAKSNEFTYGIPKQVVELDEADNKILKAISNDARISVLDLAERTGLTRDIINYRLKKLSKEKIIARYSCYPRLENIGINLYKLIIGAKNFDEQSEKKIRSYIANHKKATQLLKLIGSWDLEIEFEVENEDELYKNINEIRKEFSDIIRDFDIIRVTETFKLNFYPF